MDDASETNLIALETLARERVVRTYDKEIDEIVALLPK